MSHWQTFPGARQLGTSFFCYSLLLVGCQFFLSWHTPWQCLQETRVFSLMEHSDPSSKSPGLCMWHLGLWWFSPLLAHLTFVHSFHRVFTEPQNSLALCWAPGTQELSRPPLLKKKKDHCSQTKGQWQWVLLQLLTQSWMGCSGKTSWREWLLSWVRPDVPAGVNQVPEERRKAFQAEGKACAKKAGTTSVALGKLSTVRWGWRVFFLSHSTAASDLGWEALM